jgi:molecular chaperone GrpE
MPGDENKGAFSADVPSDLIEEAVRSVEKHAPSAAPAGEPGAPPAEGADPASLAAQLELSQQRGRELLEKLREEHERTLRAAADLDNFKKRAAREREEVAKFGTERLVKDLLPVVDNLERALAAAPPDDPLAGGVRMVLRGLEEALARHGVKAFSALGQAFDPRLHEALVQVPTADQPPGTVVAEHGRGFLMNDRLLRPAIVGVARAPASEESAAGGSGGSGE